MLLNICDLGGWVYSVIIQVNGSLIPKPTPGRVLGTRLGDFINTHCWNACKNHSSMGHLVLACDYTLHHQLMTAISSRLVCANMQYWCKTSCVVLHAINLGT